MKEIGEEDSSYPVDRTIKWKSSRRSFQYYIVKEGTYPCESYLAYTKKPNSYPIPDDYVVETTYGKDEKTVTCSISYHNEKPRYKIEFGVFGEERVYSDSSPSAAANAYLKACIRPFSEITNFYILTYPPERLIPFSPISVISPAGKIAKSGSNRMQVIRNKNFGTSLKSNFEDQIKQQFTLNDNVTINELRFTVNNSSFRIVYQSKKNDEVSCQTAIVRAIDYNKISRASYRSLAAICQDLPREKTIYERLYQINNFMNKNIPISLIDLNLDLLPEDQLDSELDVHIMDSEIIDEVKNSIGKGVTRSIKDVLNFIIPSLIEKGILNYSESTLHIRISGDGRNVGNKIKHVMVTFTILNNMNVFKSDSHLALLIYPGAESYDTLHIALSPLIRDLNDIKSGFVDKSGYKWNIKLYISADWKFLSICLGHKSANSANFCLWCLINKSQNGIGVFEINNEQDNWTISKKIEDINQRYSNIPGHKYPPLFPMIPIQNWVVDELHLMLRIYDRLWMLVLSELRSTRCFTDQIRQMIVSEMNRINVHFQFWENQETKTWAFTALMGKDKLKVLRDFNLDIIFVPQRAAIIRKLWDGFNNLYNDMHNLNISGNQFHQKARQWLKLFLTRSQGNVNSPGFIRGLYRPTDITPYIHVLVYHVPEFIDIHQNLGVSAFSCCGVEKKNYDHVLHFFRRTMRDGGIDEDQKSAILEIMECESRSNFFYTHDIPNYFEKDTTINDY
ncbi:42220_t:CDS:2 [Gigaspora margarita]|uniref:42220_t:CDS:1 n=1 Tax=Gigaspora margarita TaxID=4874 RepID=A0ABN7VD60_GIGMA|nr:42220_t:CDS:2 [Gigaspora margarita]